MANKIINSLQFNSGDINVLSLPYGICETAATTAEKVVTVENFALETGAQILVKFTVTNSASNPTLNVKNTGAKPIYYKTEAIKENFLEGNKIYKFVYNGYQWDVVGDVNIKTPMHSVSVGDANTHYYKLFTIQPSKTGYGDLHYSFEINDRSNQFTKVYIYTQSVNDNKYFGTTTIRYEGELGSNITAYRFKDTINKVERLEIWGTISSWNTWKIIP
jgi:hypothetical protein